MFGILQLQDPQFLADEVNALQAIYGDDNVTFEPSFPKVTVHSITPLGLSSDDFKPAPIEIVEAKIKQRGLKLTLYPPKPQSAHAAGYWKLEAPWLSAEQLNDLKLEVKRRDDFTSLFEVISYIAEKLPLDIFKHAVLADLDREERLRGSTEMPRCRSEQRVQQDPVSDQPVQNLDEIDSPIPASSLGFEIHIGEPIEDRKSVFQARMAFIKSHDDVVAFHRECMSDKKVAAATHNIVAYRLEVSSPDRTKDSAHKVKKADKLSRKTIVQDNDSDGESSAGYKLGHLLELMGCINVVVMVTRWYGGTNLGPDRFRHINNAARVLLEEHGASSRVRKKA